MKSASGHRASIIHIHVCLHVLAVGAGWGHQVDVLVQSVDELRSVVTTLSQLGRVDWLAILLAI